MPESPIQSFKAGSIVSKGYLILIPNKKWTAFAVYFPQYFVVVLARRQPCGVLRLVLRKISSQIQVYFLSGISIIKHKGGEA